MSCVLVGLGEEGAGENSYPPSPPPSPRRRPSTSHYGRWRDREKCPFCQGGRGPAFHRGNTGEREAAVPLPCRKVQSTPIYPPGRGEIRDGWEAFSAQVALAILKGIDPNIHSSTPSPSLAHDMYVPSSGWYMDWSEVDSRADLQCQCSFSRQNQNEVDGR